MKAGVDYVYVKKNSFGIVNMFIDEECKNFYVNSSIYDRVCKWADEFLKNEQIEVYYL